MIKIKKEKVLVSPKDIIPSSPKFEVLGTLNPGAFRLPNKDILLYVRVLEKLKKDEDANYYFSPRFSGDEKLKIVIDKFNKKDVREKTNLSIEFEDGTKRLTYISSLRRVYLNKTGLKVKSIDKKPSFFGLKWDGELGVEDARIIKLKNSYVMTYVTLSREENISTSYAISNDGMKWFRKGILFNGQNKDVVIFPERIKGKYFAFERPEGGFQFSMPDIWISHSKDMQLWGKSKPLNLPYNEWDSGRSGAGPPPIKTKKGWLLLYHAVTKETKEIRAIEGTEETITSYLVGAALFDLKNPRKLLAKSENPILLPTQKYEQGTFEYKRVVFPTGAIMDSNNKDLLIYSGAGDRFTTVKKVGLQDILDSLKKIEKKKALV